MKLSAKSERGIKIANIVFHKAATVLGDFAVKSIKPLLTGKSVASAKVLYGVSSIWKATTILNKKKLNCIEHLEY